MTFTVDRRYVAIALSNNNNLLPGTSSGAKASIEECTAWANTVLPNNNIHSVAVFEMIEVVKQWTPTVAVYDGVSENNEDLKPCDKPFVDDVYRGAL